MPLSPEQRQAMTERLQLLQREESAQPTQLAPEQRQVLEQRLMLLQGEEQAENAKLGTPATLTEQLQTAPRSLAEGISGGLSEPVISALQAPVLSGGAAYLNAREQGADFMTALQQGFSAATDPEELQEAIAFDVERRKQLKAQMPVADIGAQIAGAVTPVSVASKAYGLAAKGVGAIPKLGQAAGYIPNIIKGGLIAAGGAAPTVATSELSKLTSESAAGNQDFAEGLTGLPGKVYEGTKEAAKFGAAIPAATGAVSGLYKGSKKALQFLGGVSEKNINKYLDDFENIRKAPTKDELTHQIEKSALKIENEFKAAKLKKSEAESLFKQLKKEAQDAFADKKINLKGQIKDLENKGAHLFQGKLEKIKETASPIEITGKIQDSIGKIKKKVIDGSNNATDLLDKIGGTVKKRRILRAITDQQNKLKVSGVTVGATREQAIAKLKKLKGQIDKFGDDINLPDLKGIIRSLDDDVKYLLEQNQFSDAFNGAAAKSRSAINNILRKQAEGSGYNEAMDAVAKNAKLLEAANKSFGDASKTERILKRIGASGNRKEKDILKQIGDEVGIDFSGAVKKAEAAKRKVLTQIGREKIRQEVPQYLEAERLRGKVSQLSRPATRRAALESVTKKAQTKIDEATKALDDANKKFQQVQSLSRIGGSKKALETALSSSRDSSLDVFRRLSKLSDEDFVKTIDRIKTSEAFKKGARNGSRNVNLFGALGGLIGSTIGGGLGLGTVGGISTGALIGGYVDDFGPVVTKKILDGVIKMGAAPTIKKIRDLNIPPEAKQRVIDQFINYQTVIKKKRKDVMEKKQ